MNTKENTQRNRSLKSLFNRRSYSEKYLNLNIFTRIFCWIKTLICLTFYLTKPKKLENRIDILEHHKISAGDGFVWSVCKINPSIYKEWNVYLCVEFN